MAKKKKARRGRPPKAATTRKKKKKYVQTVKHSKGKVRAKVTKAKAKKPKSPLDGFCLAVGDRLVCIDPINGAELIERPKLENVERFESLGAARKWLGVQGAKWEENEKTAGDDPGDTHKEPFPLASATAEPIKAFYTFDFETIELDDGDWSFETKIVWRDLGRTYPTAAGTLSHYQGEIISDVRRERAVLETLKREHKERLKAAELDFKDVSKDAISKLAELNKELARFEKFKAKILKKF